MCPRPADPHSAEPYPADVPSPGSSPAAAHPGQPHPADPRWTGPAATTPSANTASGAGGGTESATGASPPAGSRPGRRPRRRIPGRLLAALAILLAVGVLGPFVVLQWSALPDPASGENGACAGRSLTATRELRGMWITTVNNSDWPSRPGLDQEKIKAEYRSWLDLAQRLRFNAVFVHVRPSGDAFWPSQYAPWSEFLTGRRDGRDPGWDPLAFMVAETHARNLEFHAWFNPYKAGQTGDINKLAPNHPLRKHPQWAVAYPKRGDGGRLYYDPGNPEARRFVENSILDPVNRYDIDGVHFDDFFYPYRGGSKEDFGDDASFARHGGSASRGDWRRENVNRFVREMNERIKAAKPWVVFGISPFGIWRNASTDPAGSATRGLQSYDAIYADTRRWVREHWLDYIAPQLYWHIGFDVADYAKLLPWWAKIVEGSGVRLYTGQADYRIGQSGAWRNPAQLDRQLALNRRYGVSGSIHFSASQVRADKLGGVTRYVKAHYGTPALPPTLDRARGTRPAAPAIILVRQPTSGYAKPAGPPGTVGPDNLGALDNLGAPKNTSALDNLGTPAGGTGATGGNGPAKSSGPAITGGPAKAGSQVTHGGPGGTGVRAGGGRATGDDEITVSWRPGKGAPPTSFAIYRVDEAAGGTPAVLVATVRRAGSGRHSWTDRTAVPGRRYAYCVTALDRVGAESVASAPARFPDATASPAESRLSSAAPPSSVAPQPSVAPSSPGAVGRTPASTPTPPARTSPGARTSPPAR